MECAAFEPPSSPLKGLTGERFAWWTREDNVVARWLWSRRDQTVAG